MRDRLAGFSLIETLVYAALLSLITGIFFATAFVVQDAHIRDRSRQDLSETGGFLHQKFQWILGGVPAASVRVPTTSGDVLEVQSSSGIWYRVGLTTERLTITRDTNGSTQFEQSDTIGFLTPVDVRITQASWERQTRNNQPVIIGRFTLQQANLARTIEETFYLL